MVHSVSSNMNFIGRLRVTQSNVYSHMVIELSDKIVGYNSILS